ncbi:MAG: hypothetical protein ACK47B_15715 [Armatimonadota bacterium]
MGAREPSRWRVLDSWRIDLNGDGTEEVLWTARSREAWKSPYREGPGRAVEGDFALLGLRFLSRGRVREVALAFESANTQVAAYRVFAPLDVNGDGRLEILAYARYFEEDALLAITFDGNQVKGVLGTRLPSRSRVP